MKENLKNIIKSGIYPKRYFSDSELSRMRSVSIVDFVIWYDESLIIKERGNYRLKNNNSVVLNGIWARDFKEDKSYTAISFCVKYLGLGKYGAMYVLSEFLRSDTPQTAETSHLMKKEAFESRLKDGTYIIGSGIKSIFAYLCTTRQISRHVVRSFIDEGYIYAEVLPKGYNLLFSIYNNDGEIVGFERTGILSNSQNRYKGCIITRQYIGFSYNHTLYPTADKTVIAFESVVDLMSVLTLEEQGKVVFPQDTNIMLISLRGLQERVLEQFLSPGDTLILCTDNDTAGIKFSQRMKEQYPDLTAMNGELGKYHVKDWNELLTSGCCIDEPIAFGDEIYF